MTQIPTKADCVFCQIVAKKLPADIVYKDDWVLAFRDRVPKAEVHVLCVPKGHRASLTEFTGENEPELLHLMKGVQAVVKKLGLTSFKLVINDGKSVGQIVPHVHIHILSGLFSGGKSFI